MKLNSETLAKCVKWVEENGLHPQAAGASVKAFCEAMGIARATYFRWIKKETFEAALAQAREVFQQETVVEVVNALKRKALGYTTTKVLTIEGRGGVSQRTECVEVPPDTNAAIFLLTNLDPDNWKNRRDTRTDVDLDLSDAEPPVIIFGEPDAQQES